MLRCSAPFFYTKLVAAGNDGVSHWMKEVDLFNKRLWLLPVHLGAHWCLAVVDILHHQMFYYDSLGGTNEVCLPLLKQYILSFGQCCTIKEWSAIVPKEIPQQDNNSDCGVFVCMYARCLAEKKEFLFTQQDMTRIRRQIAFQLFVQKL